MSKCVKCGNEILTGDIHWEMGLCNNCYNELYKDHKTHISLDKMWLELAQSFRDKNEKLQDKVANLEAKLAEMTKKYELASCPTGGLVDRVRNLEQQLAEKDKELSEYVKIVDDLHKQLAELQKQLKEKEKCTYTGKEVGEIERKYDEKIDTLEQKLKSQPAEIMEKIKEFVDGNAYYYEEEQYAKHIIKYLDDILKEYQK